jgi:quercetin dioxygenase-like cupin family protein
MRSNTVHSDAVESKQLPGRTVKVLSEALPVRNLTFGLCEVPPHAAMFPHGHVQEEVIFILEGHGNVDIGGQKESVRAGSLVHFPSGVEHFTTNEGDGVMRFAFCFSPPVVLGSYDKRTD